MATRPMQGWPSKLCVAGSIQPAGKRKAFACLLMLVRFCAVGRTRKPFRGSWSPQWQSRRPNIDRPYSRANSSCAFQSVISYKGKYCRRLISNGPTCAEPLGIPTGSVNILPESPYALLTSLEGTRVLPMGADALGGDPPVLEGASIDESRLAHTFRQTAFSRALANLQQYSMVSPRTVSEMSRMTHSQRRR